jgi:hypothetical protein
MVFGEGLSNYSLDRSLPNFIFLIERLLPTFLQLERIKSLPYIHTENTMHSKYKPYFNDIAALSELKALTNKYGSHELSNVWLFYRNQFITNNNSAMRLE